MTTGEASEKFNLSKEEIRARKNANMIIGAYNKRHRIVIPDDTILIPSKKDIQSFLLQIIKYKNNNSIAISRALCPGKDQLHAVMKYLYKRGFIGNFTFSEEIKTLFDNVQITDSGFDFVFDYGSFGKLSNITPTPIQLNPSINVSLVKVG